MILTLSAAALACILLAAPPPDTGGPPAGAAPAPAEITPPSLSGVWVLNHDESDDLQKGFAEIFKSLPAPAQRGGRGGQRGGAGNDGRGGMGPGGGRGPGGMGGGVGPVGGMGPGGGVGGGVRPGGGMGGGTGPGGGAGPGEGFGGDQAGGQGERGATVRFGGDDKEQAPPPPREPGANVIAAWERLLVAHTGSEVEVIDALDGTKRYVPTPAPRDSVRDPAPLRETVRWEEGRLIVRTRLAGGPPNGAAAQAPQAAASSLVTTFARDEERDQLVVTVTVRKADGSQGPAVRMIYDPAARRR